MGKGQSKPTKDVVDKSEEDFVKNLIDSLEKVNKEIPEVVKNLQKVKNKKGQKPVIKSLI